MSVCVVSSQSLYVELCVGSLLIYKVYIFVCLCERERRNGPISYISQCINIIDSIMQHFVFYKCHPQRASQSSREEQKTPIAANEWGFLSAFPKPTFPGAQLRQPNKSNPKGVTPCAHDISSDRETAEKINESHLQPTL